MLGEALAVSIPASQLEQLSLRGSIFAWRDIVDAPLPPELRVALLLVTQAAQATKTTLRFVARPEIFTHGASRAWLDAQLAGTQHHLSLTDGHALKLIPGLTNHMFFYARGMPAAEEALRRLIGAAPELFEGLGSQVNGGLSFRIGQRKVKPAAQLLRFKATPAVGQPLLAPLILNCGNPAYSAQRAAAAALHAKSAPVAARPLHYVLLSEAALADPVFLGELALLVQRGALGVGAEMLVLGLPPGATPNVDLADRIAPVFRALADSRVIISHATSWDLRLATEPPSAAEMKGGRITLHQATPFWRVGMDVLSAAAAVEVAGGAGVRSFRSLLGDWLGFEPALRVADRGAAAFAVTAGELA